MYIVIFADSFSQALWIKNIFFMFLVTTKLVQNSVQVLDFPCSIRREIPKNRLILEPLARQYSIPILDQKRPKNDVFPVV